MVLRVNGEELKTDAKSIEALIKELGIENQVMAAAVNLSVVKKEDWKTYELKEDDSVEFLRFVGGG
ncbi:MAG: sulfur carrier protein ThiS [Campylobacteraceae bacterium]|jgi:sulfur carrier protein|nr:sulfur carrier protein ThiS [Campylobacteraceae bacterium]